MLASDIKRYYPTFGDQKKDGEIDSIRMEILHLGN